MRKLLIIALLLLSSKCYASDYHQSGQGHAVVYTIISSSDSSKTITNQTVGLALYRVSDGSYLDFNDNSFKASGWTTRVVRMSTNTTDGFYFRVISVDNGGIVSGEYVAIVSNDDATYGDTQAEAFELDSIAKLIKVNR